MCTLPIIIDIHTGVILNYRATGAYVADSPVMIDMLRSMIDMLNGKIGDANFDSAYLTREMCNLIDGLGDKPFIKPKSNSTRKAKGSSSWKKMITLFLKYPAEFYKHYHQRSLVESAFAALKIRRAGR